MPASPTTRRGRRRADQTLPVARGGRSRWPERGSEPCIQRPLETRTSEYTVESPQLLQLDWPKSVDTLVRSVSMPSSASSNQLLMKPSVSSDPACRRERRKHSTTATQKALTRATLCVSARACGIKLVADSQRANLSLTSLVRGRTAMQPVRGEVTRAMQTASDELSTGSEIHPVLASAFWGASIESTYWATSAAPNAI